MLSRLDHYEVSKHIRNMSIFAEWVRRDISHWGQYNCTDRDRVTSWHGNIIARLGLRKAMVLDMSDT